MIMCVCAGGQAGNIRSRFEKMASQEQEVCACVHVHQHYYFRIQILVDLANWINFEPTNNVINSPGM